MSETKNDEFAGALAKAAQSVGISGEKLEGLIQAEVRYLPKSTPDDLHYFTLPSNIIRLLELTGVRLSSEDLQTTLDCLLGKRFEVNLHSKLKEMSGGHAKLSDKDAQKLYLFLFTGGYNTPRPEEVDKMVAELGIPFKPEEPDVQNSYQNLVGRIVMFSTTLKSLYSECMTSRGNVEAMVDAIKRLRETTGIAPNPELLYPECIKLIKAGKNQELYDVITALGIPMPEQEIQDEYARFSKMHRKLGKGFNLEVGSFKISQLMGSTLVRPKEEILQHALADLARHCSIFNVADIAELYGVKVKLDENEIQSMYSECFKYKDFSRIESLYTATGVLPAEEHLKGYLIELEKKHGGEVKDTISPQKGGD